jgi:hypothetical protein
MINRPLVPPAAWGGSPPRDRPPFAVRPTVLDGLEQSLAFMDIQECIILKSVPGIGVIVDVPLVEGGLDRTIHDPGRAEFQSLKSHAPSCADGPPIGFAFLKFDRVLRMIG